MTIASSETRSRPADSIASASRSVSVRRGAAKLRSSRSTPSCQARTTTALGLGGHVYPQLGAPSLGEQLDSQGGSGGHPADDRPGHDGHLATVTVPVAEDGRVASAGHAGGTGSFAAAPTGWAGCDAGPGPRAVSGFETDSSRRDASQAT